MGEPQEAYRAGYSAVSLRDAVQGADIPCLIFYPTLAVEQPVQVGPYVAEVAVDAPPCALGDGLPLVILSHGNNGSPWTLRHLAVALARAGFLVIAPEHIGNSRSDSSLDGTPLNLENRPRHIMLAIDAALEGRLRPDLMGHIAPDRIGALGISIGGYTVLAAAGGRPVWVTPDAPFTPASPPVAVTADPRIRALALLAPATPWFLAPGALSDVRVPILLRTGSEDRITPPWHADLVRNGVPDPALIDDQVIAGAGHFSFLAPFPATMVRPDFPPAQDPPGFDRAAFAPKLAGDVVAFFNRTLAPSA